MDTLLPSDSWQLVCVQDTHRGSLLESAVCMYRKCSVTGLSNERGEIYGEDASNRTSGAAA